MAARLFPENHFLRAGPARFILERNLPPNRQNLSIIETELRHDPFAFDLLWLSGTMHYALDEKEEAADIFSTFMIRAPRSQFARNVELAMASGALRLPDAAPMVPP